jgi:hypothetical protein
MKHVRRGTTRKSKGCCSRDAGHLSTRGSWITSSALVLSTQHRNSLPLQLLQRCNAFSRGAGDGNRVRTVSLGTNLMRRIYCGGQDDCARNGRCTTPCLAVSGRTLGHREGTDLSPAPHRDEGTVPWLADRLPPPRPNHLLLANRRPPIVWVHIVPELRSLSGLVHPSLDRVTGTAVGRARAILHQPAAPSPRSLVEIQTRAWNFRLTCWQTLPASVRVHRDLRRLSLR